LFAFDVDVLISFDFEAGERGCHTQSNGDPGWPEVPPAIYINAVALINETTFTSGDEGESDFMSRTYPAGFDITSLIEQKIDGLEEEIMSGQDRQREYDASDRYEPEFEWA
jgi:hypothetical protein